MRGRLSISPVDADFPVADPVSAVIAVPVSGSAPGLLQCLRSIGRQRCAPPFGVLLLLQNCGEGTLRLVQALSGLMPYRLRLVQIEAHGGNAHVGWARRLAMDGAAQWLEDAGRADDGVILTVDADAVLPPDWLALNKAARDGGADCVVGGVDYADDTGRRLPAAVQRRLRLEAEYSVLLARIRGHFDPTARDGVNLHALTATGSLAVPVSVYRAAGRIAPLAHGARRAFADAVEANGGRVRFAAGVRVLLPAWRDAADMPTFEPVTAAVRRAQWRGTLRHMFQGARPEPAAWPSSADIPVTLAKAAAAAPNFAAAWRVIEDGSPVLHQQPPGPRALPAEIEDARKVVAALTAKEALLRGDSVPLSDTVKFRVSRLISSYATPARPVTA